MRRAWFAAIVLIMGVAGCTSDGGPSPSRTPSSATPTTPVATTATATPTPSVATTGPNVRPGEKPPVLPAAGRTNSRAGAVLFATYWFKALDWGYATTDSTLAKSLYLPTCSVCAGFIEDIDKARNLGQHFVGGRITLTGKKIISDDTRHPGAAVTDSYFNSGSVATVSRTGQIISRGKKSDGLRWRVWMTRRADDWVVIDMRRVIVQ